MTRSPYADQQAILKSRPEVKVTFAVEKEAAGEAEQVLLLGEFSQWQPIELKRMKTGSSRRHSTCRPMAPAISSIAIS